MRAGSIRRGWAGRCGPDSAGGDGDLQAVHSRRGWRWSATDDFVDSATSGRGRRPDGPPDLGHTQSGSKTGAARQLKRHTVRTTAQRSGTEVVKVRQSFPALAVAMAGFGAAGAGFAAAGAGIDGA